MFSTKKLAKCGSKSESKFWFLTSALSVLATSIKVELNTRVHELQRAGSQEKVREYVRSRYAQRGFDKARDQITFLKLPICCNFVNLSKKKKIYFSSPTFKLHALHNRPSTTAGHLGIYTKCHRIKRRPPAARIAKVVPAAAWRTKASPRQKCSVFLRVITYSGQHADARAPVTAAHTLPLRDFNRRINHPCHS